VDIIKCKEASVCGGLEGRVSKGSDGKRVHGRTAISVKTSVCGGRDGHGSEYRSEVSLGGIAADSLSRARLCA
jgi:hypothetical protein